jgi:hypothetical protein
VAADTDRGDDGIGISWVGSYHERTALAPLQDLLAAAAAAGGVCDGGAGP